MTTRTFLVVLTALAALTAAACGNDDPSSSPSSTKASIRKALVDYARCMREHGVDMPDPQFQGGRVTLDQRSTQEDDGKVRAADKACAHYREAVKPQTASPAQQAKFRKAALAHARCMREHGIENFPDPTFDGNGGAMLKLDKRSGIDPNDPEFKAAEKACEKELPQAGQTTSGGGQ